MYLGTCYKHVEFLMMEEITSEFMARGGEVAQIPNVFSAHVMLSVMFPENCALKSFMSVVE